MVACPDYVADRLPEEDIRGTSRLKGTAYGESPWGYYGQLLSIGRTGEVFLSSLKLIRPSMYWRGLHRRAHARAIWRGRPPRQVQAS